MKIKITPEFKFDKHDIGFVMGLIRSNESAKFIRDCKSINYFIGIVFLWFTIGLDIDLRGDKDE